MRSITYLVLALIAVSCGNGEPESDAYGNFTAIEIMVSAETSGRILLKNVNEGKTLSKGDIAYVIDTVQSYLKKEELLARRKAILAKKANIRAQITVFEEQDLALKNDIDRFEKMLVDGAVSQKQLDDLKNKSTILKKQIDQVRTNYSSIEAEVAAIDAAIKQVADLLDRATVKAPADGTILETYAEVGEVVAQGKPLFKLADLRSMEMKAYFSSDQLASLKIDDEIEVLVDDGEGGLKSLTGTISWIASSAEFTPKIIQTREERVNLVFAVKILVPNDGSVRINMPGEVRLVNSVNK